MSPDLPARALTLGRLLQAAGGTATVAELRASADGMSQGTAAKALSELVDAGLVERVGGAKGAPQLTAAGLVRFAGVDPVSAGEVVDAAAAVWPYTQAAFLRLYLAAVVARRHLAGARPHLGFVAVGEVGTGKSALFEQACHLLGLEAHLHLRRPALMTAGELVGRRTGGSSTTFVPAAYLARPAVLLDEFDKADPPVRTLAAKLLLQGDYRVVVEDEDLVVACAPMLAANVPEDRADRFGHLHDAYRTRRCVLLDAGATREQLGDLGGRLERFHAEHRPGELALEQLVPPVASMPEGRALWANLREFVVPGRRNEFPDERALEGLALGYAALRNVAADDAAGLQLAAIYTLIDWHACASTVPGLIDRAAGTPQLDLTEAHRAYYGGRGDLASLEAAIAAQHAGAEQRTEQARTRQRQRARVSDDVVRGRGELAEQLRLAREAIAGTKVPAEYKPTAAGLRDILAKLRTSTQQLSRPDALAEARERAAQPLLEARQLAERIAGDKVTAQRARTDAATAEKRNRAAARAAEQQQRAYQRLAAKQATTQARAQLKRVREVLVQLEKLHKRTTTRPDERPLAELERLRVVTYRSDPAAANFERPKGWRGWLKSEPSPGHWVAIDGTAYPGGPGGCQALARWGEATQAVLAAALRDGYTEEEQLENRLGMKPRARRLSLPEPPRPQVTAASSTRPALSPSRVARGRPVPR